MESASAQLVVDSNLGTLTGTTNLAGTTIGQPNNVTTYGGVLDGSGYNYGAGEYVYSFSLSSPKIVGLSQNTSNAIDGSDLDHILLTSTNAADAIGFVDENSYFGYLTPGSYVLSIDTFTGGAGFPASVPGPFNMNLLIEDVVTPSATALPFPGSASVTGSGLDTQFFSFEYTSGAFTLDTFGTTITGEVFGDVDDTELALYDSAGLLIATNDDADDTTFLSALSFEDGELAPGTYYVAAGIFNMIPTDGFLAESDQPFSGTIQVNATLVPEPTTFGLAAVAGLGLLRRRRRMA